MGWERRMGAREGMAGVWGDGDRGRRRGAGQWHRVARVRDGRGWCLCGEVGECGRATLIREGRHPHVG